MIIKKYNTTNTIKFSNGFKITHHIDSCYSNDDKPVHLDKAIKVKTSNRIKNDYTRIDEFKSIDDVMYYLKHTCQITFKQKILNQIQEII